MRSEHSLKQASKNYLDYYLESGADVNCSSDEGCLTALEFAVMDEDIDLIQKLIRSGANPYQKTESSLSAFDMALSRSVKVAEAMIDNIDINHKDSKGNNILHTFVESGSKKYSALDALLKKGANPHAKNDKGESAFSLSYKKSRDITIDQGSKVRASKILKSFMDFDRAKANAKSMEGLATKSATAIPVTKPKSQIKKSNSAPAFKPTTKPVSRTIKKPSTKVKTERPESTFGSYEGNSDNILTRNYSTKPAKGYSKRT